MCRLTYFHTSYFTFLKTVNAVSVFVVRAQGSAPYVSNREQTDVSILFISSNLKSFAWEQYTLFADNTALHCVYVLFTVVLNYFKLPYLPSKLYV